MCQGTPRCYWEPPDVLETSPDMTGYPRCAWEDPDVPEMHPDVLEDSPPPIAPGHPQMFLGAPRCARLPPDVLDPPRCTGDTPRCVNPPPDVPGDTLPPGLYSPPPRCVSTPPDVPRSPQMWQGTPSHTRDHPQMCQSTSSMCAAPPAMCQGTPPPPPDVPEDTQPQMFLSIPDVSQAHPHAQGGWGSQTLPSPPQREPSGSNSLWDAKPSWDKRVTRRRWGGHTTHNDIGHNPPQPKPHQR